MPCRANSLRYGSASGLISPIRWTPPAIVRDNLSAPSSCETNKATPLDGTFKSFRGIVSRQGPLRDGRLKFLDCAVTATAPEAHSASTLPTPESLLSLAQ